MLPLAQGYCSIFSLPCKGLILAGRKKLVRPDYVASHENENYEALCINGHWYLYERRRGRNKAHTCIGRITENGIRPTRHRINKRSDSHSMQEPEVLSNLSLTSCEYGFSRTLLELCPDSWKDFVGQARWKDELIDIIVAQSPHSYLKKEQRESSENRNHIGNHRRYLQHELGITIEKLWLLMGNISWIQGTDMSGITALNPEQIAFCQEHHICLEVMS